MKPTKRHKGMKARLNEVHGTAELNAWLVADDSGVHTVRIQTRCPAFVKSITQLGRCRDKPRLVAYGCSGGFLKVFELQMPLTDALAFIEGQLEQAALRAA
jgi:hypothetical protein